MLDLGDPAVQISAEVFNASVPADVGLRVSGLLGRVHGVEDFFQSVVGVVSGDGLVGGFEGGIKAGVCLGEGRLVLRVVVSGWGLVEMAEIAVLGVARHFILAVVFSIFDVLIAVDLRLVDVFVLALWSCIGMLSRVSSPRSLEIAVFLFPFLQLPDKARIWIDLHIKLVYLVAILEYVFVGLIVGHSLVFDEISEDEGNRA